MRGFHCARKGLRFLLKLYRAALRALTAAVFHIYCPFRHARCEKALGKPAPILWGVATRARARRPRLLGAQARGNSGAKTMFVALTHCRAAGNLYPVGNKDILALPTREFQMALSKFTNVTAVMLLCCPVSLTFGANPVPFTQSNRLEIKSPVSVTFSRERSAYVIEAHNGVMTATLRDTGVVQTLPVAAQRLFFSDINVALDVGGHAGVAYRLYFSAFGRPPDRAWLTFAIHFLDHGASTQALAAELIASADFKTRYDAPLTDAQFVDMLYENMQSVPPKPDIREYWVSFLTYPVAHGATRQAAQAELLASFARSNGTHASDDPITDELVDGIEFGGEREGVFAPPSGPLCARTTLFEPRCVTPTSSATTLSDLHSFITNAGSNRVGFSLPGYTQITSFPTLIGRLASGTQVRMRYTLMRKTVMFGDRFVDTSGEHYQATRLHADDGDKLRFVAYDRTSLTMHRQTGEQTWLLHQAYDLEGTIRAPRAISYWQASLGLLTDTLSAPTERTLRFDGVIHVVPATPLPLQRPRIFTRNRLSEGVSCPITLVLDIVAAAILPASANCIDRHGLRLSIQLPSMQVRHSRVVPAPAARVNVALNPVRPESNPNSRATWTVRRIDGTVTGRDAALLKIVGVAESGYFQIEAKRGARSGNRTSSNFSIKEEFPIVALPDLSPNDI